MIEFPNYIEASARQLARTDVPAGFLPVFRWYLEHPAPGSVVVPKPPRADLSVSAHTGMSTEDYLTLYRSVGRDWLWADRLRMDHDALENAIAAPHVTVHVLNVEGTPAGYFELDTRPERAVHLAYFGLMPGFTGQRLGPYLLATAIHTASTLRSGPLTIDTCTLDSPGALKVYQRAGFVVQRAEDELFPDPRLDGTLPLESGAHVPLAQPMTA